MYGLSGVSESMSRSTASLMATQPLFWRRNQRENGLSKNLASWGITLSRTVMVGMPFFRSCRATVPSDGAR